MIYDLNIKSTIEKDGLPSGMYPVVIYQLIRQYSNTNNKILISNILDTLKEYWKGDENKQFSQSNLHRTLKRNLESLMYFDTNIHAEDKNETEIHVEDDISMGKIYRVWYEQELSYTDLQLLSDAIIYSRHLSNSSRRELMNRLMRISGQSPSDSKWYNSILNDAEAISIQVPVDLYNNLEKINIAIHDRKCLSFDYTYWGPAGKKYKVSTYNGISPYKIIHDNGIYYLLASRNNVISKRNQLYLSHNKKIPVVFFEIHKLDKLDFDEYTYIDIKGTNGNDKTIQYYLSEGYHPLNHELLAYTRNKDLTLQVSSRGLDILIDTWGGKVRSIIKTGINDKYAGKNKELSHIYQVTLRNLGQNEWYELIILLLKYSVTDIDIIKPKGLITPVIRVLSKRLNDK